MNNVIENFGTTSAFSGRSGSRTVIALVSSAAVGGIREAYPNYFADSTEFPELLNIIENVKDPRRKSLFGRFF